MNPVRILTGDVLDSLRTMPDGCVQCCVTSPPYWGLRDYGTATWEGGDAACDHKAPSRFDYALNSGLGPTGVQDQASNAGSGSVQQYRSTCGKCGARRIDQQIGLEPTPEAFIEKMVAVFAEVRRVLRDDGTLWLNIGDSYAAGKCGRSDSFDGRSIDGKRVTSKQAEAPTTRTAPDGLKPKDLCMMPWRVALALQADGWYLRSVIVWAKKSPMPESVRDRPTSSWEPIFLMSKSPTYFYDAEAVKERSTVSDPSDENYRANGHSDSRAKRGSPGDGIKPGMKNDGFFHTPTRNLRNVWHLGPEPYAAAHFATFVTEIPRRAILAGTSEKGCCPECGAGWERVVESTLNVHGRKQAIAEGGKATGGRDATNAATWGAMYPAGSNVTKTTGWKPGCECGHAPIPCTVLDPFLGSGTTIAVARQLGRHGIGCELNPEYVKLAEDRIGKAEKPNTYASARVEDSPLFGGGI